MRYDKFMLLVEKEGGFDRYALLGRGDTEVTIRTIWASGGSEQSYVWFFLYAPGHVGTSGNGGWNYEWSVDGKPYRLTHDWGVAWYRTNGRKLWAHLMQHGWQTLRTGGIVSATGELLTK